MKRWAAVVGAVIFSFSLQARAITKPCDGCSADQMYETALASLAEMHIGGPLYLVDLRAGVVQHFRGLGIQIVDVRSGLGGYGYYMTCTPSACHIYILPQ